MRLFLGLPVPEPVASELEERTRLAAARWTGSPRLSRASDLHLTLRFLGETEPARLPEVMAACREALARVRCGLLTVQLAGLGIFRGAGAIFAEVQAPAKLLQLQDALSEALAWRGVPRELRDFHPHVTLARRKHGLPQPELDRWNGIWVPVSATFQELVLYRSVAATAEQQGRYERLEVLRLDGGA